MNSTQSIKIEVWSDIACPFCYIGKRKLEFALAQFKYSDRVKIEWKSFMLDPNKITDPTISIAQSLAKRKGISVNEALNMADYVTEAAKSVNLEYDFTNMIVANTFKAHRFLHYAKQHKLQTKAKESVLKAYFLDNKNIDDTDTLIDLGKSIGLNAKVLESTLNSNQYAEDVKLDMTKAKEIGVQGVPFFVFNGQFVLSGAQAVETFLSTLQKCI